MFQPVGGAPAGGAPGTQGPGPQPPGAQGPGSQGRGPQGPGGQTGQAPNPSGSSGPGTFGATAAQQTGFSPGGGPTGPSPFPSPASSSSPANAAPESDDTGEPGGGTNPAMLATLFGFVAILVTVVSLYGLGTDFDTYYTYGAGFLGFLAVLLGFAGLGRARGGGSGRVRSFLAIFAGFLAIGLNTYEYLYPQELHDKISGLFGG